MSLPKVRTSRANTRMRRSRWKATTQQLITITTPDGTQHQVPQRLAAAAKRGYLPK